MYRNQLRYRHSQWTHAINTGRIRLGGCWNISTTGYDFFFFWKIFFCLRTFFLRKMFSYILNVENMIIMLKDNLYNQIVTITRIISWTIPKVVTKAQIVNSSEENANNAETLVILFRKKLDISQYTSHNISYLVRIFNNVVIFYYYYYLIFYHFKITKF